MGRLTTHALSTSSGKPAAGLKTERWLGEDIWKTVITTGDGRVEAAVLAGESRRPGSQGARVRAGA